MPPLSACATLRKHHSPGCSFTGGRNTMGQLCLLQAVLWPGEPCSLLSTHVALVGHGPPEHIQQTQPSLHLLETEQEAFSICSLLQVLTMSMEKTRSPVRKVQRKEMKLQQQCSVQETCLEPQPKNCANHVFLFYIQIWSLLSRNEYKQRFPPHYTIITFVRITQAKKTQSYPKPQGSTEFTAINQISQHSYLDNAF